MPAIGSRLAMNKTWSVVRWVLQIRWRSETRTAGTVSGNGIVVDH